MIVQCADCKTRYELDASRVPSREIRVRCPKCRAVFAIDGQRVAEAGRVAAAQAAPAPVSAQAPPQPQVARKPAAAPIEPTPLAPAPAAAAGVQIERNAFASPQASPVAQQMAAPPEMDFEIERSAGPAMSQGRPTAHAGAPAQASPATAVADAPAKPKADPVNEKAKRLARALVSDILVYHRDARDQALTDGNLVQVLGQEIKKSWELYKERVTPEVANSTNYFREALNEILTDGQQIF